MKTTIVYAVLLLITFYFIPTTGNAETLQEAVQKIIITHPDVRSAGYNRLGRDEEVRQAESNYYPQIDIDLGAGHSWIEKPVDTEVDPREATISLRQNLFTGLETKNEVIRQEARVRSQAYLVRSTADNTALEAAKVYLNVLKNEAIFKLAEENLILHQKISDQIRLRSESGVSSQADMDQIRSRLSLAESNVIVAEQNLADAKTNYLASVGQMPYELSDPVISQDLLPVSLEVAETLALEYHPTLQSANADLSARHAQDEVAKGVFMPTIDFELDKVWEKETDYSIDEIDDLRAMVRLRYTLFNGWEDNARKKETHHLINEAREIRNLTQRQVIEHMRLSWQAYQSSFKRINFLNKRVQFATATANSYNQQWNIGQRTLLDVLDSEAERIDASQELVTAQYDKTYAQYRILNAIGMLVPSLGLEWPEEGLLEEEQQNPKPPVYYTSDISQQVSSDSQPEIE